MILDNQATYATAQTVTATGDTASTNSYDHGPGSAGAALGDLMLVAKTNAAVTSGGAATVQIVLQDSADNTTFADVAAYGGANALAAMGANKTLAVGRLPARLRRYTRVVFRVGTAALTGGTFSAFVVFDTDLHQYLPGGFSV